MLLNYTIFISQFYIFRTAKYILNHIFLHEIELFICQMNTSNVGGISCNSCIQIQVCIITSTLIVKVVFGGADVPKDKKGDGVAIDLTLAGDTSCKNEMYSLQQSICGT